MLSSHDNPSLQTDENIFEEIIRLARRSDVKSLKNLFSQDYCIGHKWQGVTAVEKLATEGDVDAVNILLDYFCASMNCAARGYARAGNVEQVEVLINMGARMEFAIEGYAIAQLDEQVYDLINRGAEVYYAIYGYAQVNAIEKMMGLDSFATGKLNKPVEGVTIAELRYNYDNIEDAWHAGFAKAGNIKLLDALKGRQDTVDYRRILVYAEAGLVDYVYACITNATNQHIAIRRAVEGFAMGGHQEQVEQLLLTGTDIGDAIYGYAKSGMVRQAEELLKRSDDKVVAYVYLVAGLMKAGIVSKVDVYVQAGMREIKWLLGLLENERESDFPDYRDAWDAGNMYTDDRICLKILSFTNTVKLREILVRKLEDRASDQDKDKYQVLAAKAREINRWMNEYDLGYSSALRLISLTESERVWCLQGSQMTRKREGNDAAPQPMPIIPYEVFLSITSQLLELSIKNTELVVAALHESLMAGSIKRNVRKFENGFFTRQQMIEENMKANDRFSPVIRFN